jgi:hypothetical protein
VPDIARALYTGKKDKLQDKVSEFTEDLSSTLDSRHIREGVVIRVEAPDGTTDWYKNKSFTFGVLEGYLKDSDDYVDAEEIA